VGAGESEEKGVEVKARSKHTTGPVGSIIK